MKATHVSFSDLHPEHGPQEATMHQENSAIITCPGCTTRFFITRSEIRDQEHPRFHCSRCDLLFQGELSAAPSSTFEYEEPPVLENPDIDDQHLQASFGAPNTSQGMAKAAPSEFLAPVTLPESMHEPLPSTSMTSFSSPSYHTSPKITAPFSTSSRMSRDLDDDEPLVSHIDQEVRPRSVALVEEPQEQPSSKYQFQLGDADTKTVESTPAPRQSPVYRRMTTEAPHEGPIGSEAASVEIEGVRRPVSRKKAEVRIESEENQLSLNLRQKNKGDRVFLSLPKLGGEQWRGLSLMASPILLCLTLLIAVSYCLRVEPSFARSVNSTFFRPISEISPAGLNVHQAELRSVVLETGNTVYIISGKVTNNTEENFKDIQVEGLVFDRKGQLIRTGLALVGSPLVAARLRSLSLSEIEQLQMSTNAKGNELKPGQTRNFVVALNEDSLGKGRAGDSTDPLKRSVYFSARVYSSASS